MLTFSLQVMKPMLERKRRARINRCLDELKELMSSALAAEGENLTKLEKADVLELTVRHLHKLRERQALGLNPAVSAASYADKFRAGFTHCAAEVSRYLATSTGLDGDCCLTWAGVSIKWKPTQWPFPLRFRRVRPTSPSPLHRLRSPSSEQLTLRPARRHWTRAAHPLHPSASSAPHPHLRCSVRSAVHRCRNRSRTTPSSPSAAT